MTNLAVFQKLIITPNEAALGVKKLITRRGKSLEVDIPAGVHNGYRIRLTGALQITDGYHGDIVLEVKIKSQHSAGLTAAIVSCLLLVILFFTVKGYFVNNSGDTTENNFKSTRVYEDGAMHVGGDGHPIELINNPEAKDPTYAQLVAFIKSDPTDSHPYIKRGPGAYVCSDFAEDVHNNAERSGIKAAWVGLDFIGESEGHALTAFDTTDRGIVYIDCQDQEDTVAYIEPGEEYGCIPVDYAESLSYSFYREYKQTWQNFNIEMDAYNEEVSRFNREIDGHIYEEGSLELLRIENWEAELNNKGQMLTAIKNNISETWIEELGVVEDINIHW